MIDCSNYSINKETFFSGAEIKYELIINGFKYIMKFQKNSEAGLTFSHVSEYLGSHVFSLAQIPVQETVLGTYQGKNVVLLKNFCKPGETLVHFNDVGESTLEQNKDLFQYNYDDIQKMLQENTKSTNVSGTIERFWDMFIIDALNGNFDRHGGNWGFIKYKNMYTIAPVYDNGSCMFPKLNSDEKISSILDSDSEIDKRIYDFPTSQIRLNGKKSSYYDIINSLSFEECNKALTRIVPRINLDRIFSLIDSIECISDTRKLFYKVMYKNRFRKILLEPYQKITERKTV